MNYRLSAYAIQDIGKRSKQEDSFFPPFLDPCHYDATSREWSFYDGTPHTDDRLFIVCDGMGGHDRGDVASRTVARTMSQTILQTTSIEGFFNDDILRHAVNEALRDLAVLDNPNEKLKMGTTMTVLKFHAQGATVGHIGDSRVYQFRPATKTKPAQILFRTEDHTMVNDLVHHGQLTYAQAMNSSKKHILSRAMMSDQQHRADIEIDHIADIQPGDVFMLCTDGIFENLDDDALCALLTDPNYGDLQRIQAILQVCLDNRDNHTAYIVRVEDVLNTPEKMKSHAALTPGTVLQSKKYTYHIEKVLGHGAFGITYLVNTSVLMEGALGTIQTGVKFALKEFFMEKEMKREGSELLPVSENSKDKVKNYASKFRHEASKLASLSHPNIVKVLEVFEANNTIYYAMEYLPDGSLNDYVNKQGGIPEREAIAYIRQAGSALLYMHTNKLLHLDVKPANIMRASGSNTLKIIDFGLAKRYEENGNPETSSNLGFGTLGYAPLEQVNGSNEVTFSPSLDVYALGATYYKLLTSLTPSSAIDILNKGLNTMPLVKKKVSQQSIDAIRAAMQPMQANRLKTVQEFLDMLPRVDDETVFPEKYDKSIWHSVMFPVVVALLGICAGACFMHARYSTNSADTAVTIDSTFHIPTVRVEGGTFIMGCADTSNPEIDEDERILRHVTVSSFLMATHEVTQAQWKAVMENEKVKKSKNGTYPVVNVSFDDIKKFIKRLNKKTGRHFRLPTEAEWEYAARGGVFATSDYQTSDSLAWNASNSGGHLHPVCSLSPNALGVYDLFGNAWEYCSDWYDSYEGDNLVNPEGPSSGDYHVIRGGSCTSPISSCRPTYRQDDSLPTDRDNIGFRLVESVEESLSRK